MNQLEENVTRSFKLVKNDIIRIQNTVSVLAENQQRIMELLGDTREKEVKLYETMKTNEKANKKANKKTKTVSKRAKTTYIASKTGKKLHNPTCPFAKNIKPKSKVVFNSKAKALNQGFKACECLKKI